MKSYRIQIRHKGWYYDELISGEDEENALVNFFLKGFEGKIQPKDADPIFLLHGEPTWSYCLEK